VGGAWAGSVVAIWFMDPSGLLAAIRYRWVGIPSRREKKGKSKDRVAGVRGLPGKPPWDGRGYMVVVM